MAGSIALSLTQRYDKTSHLPLDGGQLTFYAAGTTTPQSAYQDISLTIPWPNPIELDSGGNVPQLFFADGYIKFRLANADGVVQIAADYVLVLGPTSGAGAAPSVDATTIMQPGFLAPYYGVGVRTGFVRANGRTIGSATSGASELASATCEDLFGVLYDDPNLAVSGGRGASAAADWAANKTIALPDWRGRAIAGLDDMGNTAAGRLTATYFGTAATVLGAAGGTESRTLSLAQLPTGITSSGSNNITVGGTNFPSSGTSWNTVNVDGGATYASTYATGGTANASSLSGSNAISVTSNNTSGAAHATASPAMLATLYIKL